jgi:hypothetical protein
LGGVDVAAALTPDGAGAYRLSGNVPRNVVSAFVGSFVLPQEYHYVMGAARTPYLGAGILLAVIAATLRWVRDRSAVLLGLVWILVMSLPTALFDYDQFGDRQITVSRYLYAGMAGVALLGSAWFHAAIGDRPLRRIAMVAAAVVAAAWIYWNTVCIRYQIAWYRSYGIARTQLVVATLRWARERAGRGSLLYAVNWKEDDAQVRALSRLYFEHQGVRLCGEQELRDLDLPAQDSIPRYAVRYDDATRVFGLFALTDEAVKAAVLAYGARADSTAAPPAGELPVSPAAP